MPCGLTTERARCLCRTWLNQRLPLQLEIRTIHYSGIASVFCDHLRFPVNQQQENNGGGKLSASPSFWPMLAVVVVIFSCISVLPALLCRRLWRLGHRRSSRIAGLAVAVATVFVIG